MLVSRVWSLYKTLLNVQYNWSAAKFILHQEAPAEFGSLS